MGMLQLAIAFFVIAIIAGVFGFTGIAVAAAGIAKLFFYVFLILFVAVLIAALFRPKPMPPEEQARH